MMSTSSNFLSLSGRKNPLIYCNRQFYSFLFRALQSFTPEEASSEEARQIAIRLLKASINLPSRLEFDDIIALDAIQHLSNTDPEAFALLEVFVGGDLEDYEEFNDEHDGWVDDNGSLPQSPLL
jgi:translation initiation factor 3 subunit M